MKLWRRRSVVLAMLTALYVAVYCGLSATGGYVFTQSGQVRYAGSGMSVSDLMQWQPRFAFCQRFKTIQGRWRFRANPLGYFFAPLILLDQKYFHRTVQLFDPQTGKPVL